MPGTHRETAVQVAAAVARLDAVEAVLLGGSVVRGEERPTSDIDLLLIVRGEFPPVERRVHAGIMVEQIAHTEDGWIARFDRPTTSWLYAFLEAEPLYDTGPGQRLRTLAAEARHTYRASGELRLRLATSLWHGQAKLDRIGPGQPEAMGYWSSLFVEVIMDGLYTVHDVPLPAGSRRLAHLPDVPLTADEARGVQDLLAGTAAARFDATRRLVASLRERLGPADHEREPVPT